MNAKRLRSSYIEFFRSKGHREHPSAPLVPVDVMGRLDETLLFTGAGMVQFKPYFRGLAVPPCPRLVTSQKCVRAVDIEEVGNPSHLTFFEMLGNFSFGDYFKKEAIEYAWEFLTSPNWLSLEPKKLCVTVYEEDDEAYALWARIWEAAGFDPKAKIQRMGEEKNYWPAGAYSGGPPGPCGPCTEIFYQVAPDSEMTGDYKTDEAAGRWLEIWNLVFMQYEWKGRLRNPERPELGYQKESMKLLPLQGVDTGMGLERTAAVLGDFAGDVYQTDVFWPIVQRIIEVANGPKPSAWRKKWGKSERVSYSADAQVQRAIRVIADHVRTAVMCLADGILPSNTGRGYVLRRLIRRAVWKSQGSLGYVDPVASETGEFLGHLVPAVIAALGDAYPELRDREDVITKSLRNEERLFRKTLTEGRMKFDLALYALLPMYARPPLEDFLAEPNKRVFFDRLPRERLPNFQGREAFYLYDTFGVPIELTREWAAEAGLAVDEVEFSRLMDDARARSRAAHGAAGVFSESEEPLVVSASSDAKPFSRFVGYETTTHRANVMQISPRFDENNKTTGEFQICLDATPFYAEAGGEVGDTGRIYNDDFEFEVTDTWSEMNLIWHDAKLVRLKDRDPSSLRSLLPNEIAEYLNSGVFFKPVIAEVDAARRRDITRNHTATHLLHAALRQVLGKHVAQAGSLVAPDRLRFDFTHGQAMKPEEFELVETIVNERIAQGDPVIAHFDVPIAEARKRGAMMLFGEKYGEEVRMIEVPGFSLELCGGCHVNNTAEIGLFKIISESSIGSGVRRIEAVTGLGAYKWVRERDSLLREAAAKAKSLPDELPRAIDRLQETVRELRKEKERLLSSLAPETQATATKVGDVNLYTQALDSDDVETAKFTVDRLVENDPSAVAVVAVKADGRVTFYCKVGKQALARGAHAGNLVREVAKFAGGGGGGSPAFAQAGGKDVAAVGRALVAAADVLRAQLGC